jgi:PadR family transcriptional regulator PadR
LDDILQYMTGEVGPQLRKGVVEYCILGALSREAMYGWQLAETLSNQGVIAGIGTLYPVLTRLRDAGLISVFKSISEVGPVRKYYQLTDAGVDRLQAFREQWPIFVETVSNVIGGNAGVEH